MTDDNKVPPQTHPQDDHDSPESRPIKPGTDQRQPVDVPKAEAVAAKRPDGDADPFANLERLRLSQDFTSMADVRPILTTIAVRKPSRHEFVRTRQGTAWRFETGCYVDLESREVYLVARELWSAIPGEVRPTVLLTTISRNSPIPFLWPIPLPGPDGRPNRWHESALEAARIAEQRWARVVADLSAGCYVPHVAQGHLADPVWPDITMADLLRFAFRERFIQDMDHPVLRRLRGEV